MADDVDPIIAAHLARLQAAVESNRVEAAATQQEFFALIDGLDSKQLLTMRVMFTSMQVLLTYDQPMYSILSFWIGYMFGLLTTKFEVPPIPPMITDEDLERLREDPNANQ